MLGTFNIELDDIEDKCLPDGKPREFTESLSRSGFQELLSGHVTMNVSKTSASKEYIMMKKREIIKRLRAQMEFIDRFNMDLNNPTGTMLTANIFAMGGKSILHAAVVLMDDIDLVRTMLKLGANPRSNFHSGMGTPLSLAQRNLHSALDRAMRLKNSDTPQQVQRCKQARALVQILQENVIEFPAAISTMADPLSEALMKSSDTGMMLSNVAWHPPKTPITDNVPKPQKTGYSSIPKIPTAMRPKPPRSLAPRSSSQPLPQGDSSESTVSPKIKNVPKPQETGYSSIPQIPTTTRRKPPPSLAPRSSSQSSPHGGSLEPRAWPNVKRRNWVSNAEWDPVSGRAPVPFKFCTNGPDCRFYKQGTCRYWHNSFQPLPSEKQPPKLPLPRQDSELPDIPQNMAEFISRRTSDGSTWWTAAYRFFRIRTIVYVQKVKESSGWVGDKGVVWFSSQESALYSLRCTVYLLEKWLEANRGKNSSNHIPRKQQHPKHPKHQQHQHYQHYQRRNGYH